MTIPMRGALILTLVTGFFSDATAQVPVGTGQAIVRDNGAQPSGTGRVRGRVVDAENGTALRNTVLRLSGGGLRETRSVGTDDDGRYEFENLPAGRYSLSAMKPGYMGMAYGQRRAFETGRPIELADKQTLEEINFAVPRGGVIVARVTDDQGEPISDVRVVAQRYRFNGTQRILAPVGAAYPTFDVTDDRGEVRVYGLPPGEYYVSANPNYGGVAARDGRSYLQTFFPSTPSAETAERVSVQVGKEVNVGVALVAARVARVSGIVRRADGSPAARTPIFLSTRMGSGFGRDAMAQPNGTFAINDVPPGEYTVQAMFGGAPQTDREQGMTQVSVNGTDVTGVALTLSKGGTLRGRLTFEPERPANVALGSVRPFLAPTSPTSSFGIVYLDQFNTQNDGTFVMTGMFDAGLVRIGGPLPAGWYLKAVRLGDRDITDVPISVDIGAELTGVEIVLTETRATIGGTVADDKGTAVTDYTVVIFPADRAQWTPGSRFMFAARPDQQGRFKAMGLPAGRYLAAAADYVEAGAERDPELLDRLRARATPVAVEDGESKTIALVLQ